MLRFDKKCHWREPRIGAFEGVPVGNLEIAALSSIERTRPVESICRCSRNDNEIVEPAIGVLERGKALVYVLERDAAVFEHR